MTADPPARPAADAARASDRRFPRGLLVVGVPLAALLLITLFVFLRFPFDRFRESLAQGAGRTLGATVVIDRLDPSLRLGGPAFVMHGVRVRWPDGRAAAVQRATLRPAWSTAWLGGTPALHVDADSDLGAIVGTFVLGEAPAFDGRLESVALARLPIEALLRGTRLDGRLDFDGDLALRDGRPVGEARFESRDGSVSSPQLPIAIPYERLGGRVRFDADGSLELSDVALDGPMISARIRGGTGPSPTLLLAPLDVDVHLEVSDPTLRPALAAAGVRLGPDGAVDLKIRGNMASPVVR